MNEHARTAVLAWQRTVDAAWQRQERLLAPPLAGATPPGLPPPHASPAENAAYWRSLTTEQRERLIGEQPALVGGRDGFPAEARDRANRILLVRHRSALQAERDQLVRQVSGTLTEYAPEVHRLQAIGNELRGIRILESRLNRTPSPSDVEGIRYYLLGFGAGAPGTDATAIIAHGNPDTMPHVATYVPGAESGFVQMDRLMRESDAMYASANRLGTTSSVVTWLGYDAPDTVAHAVSPAYAAAASQPLDRFQQGLDTVNPGAHHTIVGHSYGSVVTGYAARDGGLPTDDIVALGSPGMGVSSAAELGVPPQRVWVMEANRDPIADTQAHGYDPGDDRFGANQLPADPEGRRPTNLGDAAAMAGDLADGVFNAHLDYFYDTPQTRPSHANIGDVIAGRPPTYR